MKWRHYDSGLRVCQKCTSDVLNILEGSEKKGRKGDRRPEVLRYSYDSRGASFCVKNTAFLVWRLFLLKHIKGPHEGFRNFTIFYIKMRSRIAKLLNRVDARDACHAFNAFVMN